MARVTAFASWSSASKRRPAVPRSVEIERCDEGGAAPRERGGDEAVDAGSWRWRNRAAGGDAGVAAAQEFARSGAQRERECVSGRGDGGGQGKITLILMQPKNISSWTVGPETTCFTINLNN